MVADILRLMGQPFDKKILEELIEEVDADSKYLNNEIIAVAQSQHHILVTNFDTFILSVTAIYFGSRFQFYEIYVAAREAFAGKINK